MESRKKGSESNIFLRSTAGLARLPDPHVISHRSDALAIGRPDHRPHTIPMAKHAEIDGSLHCVENLHCSIILSQSQLFATRRPGRGIHIEWGSIAPECGSQRERNGGRSRAHRMISKRAGGQKQDETADGKEPFDSTKFTQELSPSLWPFHSWNDARSRRRHSVSTLLFHPVAYPTSS